MNCCLLVKVSVNYSRLLQRAGVYHGEGSSWGGGVWFFCFLKAVLRYSVEAVSHLLKLRKST